MQATKRRYVTLISVALSLSFAVAACTVGEAPPPPTPTDDVSLAYAGAESDLDACSVTCDLLRVAVCIGAEQPAICDAGYLCDALCEENPTEQICVQVSSSEQVCCQNYYGCQSIVTPDCTYGC